ncbi:MAG: arylesterase [Gemmatimonadales bacterium]
MIVGCLAIMGAAACGGEPRDGAAIGDDPGAGTPPPSAAADARPAIVFLGTSLTAGYGLRDPSLAFPALIQRRLDSLGLPYHAVNAGVSGETSAGALRRIGWVLRQQPVAVLVIETGANDGLRGQTPDSVRANIQAIIDSARTLDPAPSIVIAGMEALPNLGEDYTTRFRALFPALASGNGATLIPFLLDGVAGVDTLNQADGIHPTPEGQEIVATTVWRALAPILDSLR